MTREDLNTVSAPVLARWLGVSGKAIYELAKAGVVVRAGGGRYRLAESVTRYCEHLRQKGRSAAALRKRSAPTGSPRADEARAVALTLFHAQGGRWGFVGRISINRIINVAQDTAAIVGPPAAEVSRHHRLVEPNGPA